MEGAYPPKVTESKICKLEFTIETRSTFAAHNKNVGWFYILMPAGKVCEHLLPQIFPVKNRELTLGELEDRLDQPVGPHVSSSEL